MWWLPLPEHREQSVIDAPELLAAHVAGQVTEPLDVHCGELLDEHTCRLSADFDLRSKRVVSS